MKTVNMTKRLKAVYLRYLNSSATSLRDIYNSWSMDKEDAFRYCQNLCFEYDGDRFRVIAGSFQFFSCGFTYRKEDGREMFVYITHGGDYEMEVLK